MYQPVIANTMHSQLNHDLTLAAAKMTPAKYLSYMLTYTMYLQRMQKSADAPFHHGQRHPVPRVRFNGGTTLQKTTDST